jgi:hypothetical protein
MNKLFFSKPYIDAHIEKVKEMCDKETENYSVSDSTYHNDRCASIDITIDGVSYLIFLPNSFEDNGFKEEYRTYQVILDREYHNVETLNEVFNSLHDAVQCVFAQTILTNL